MSAHMLCNHGLQAEGIVDKAKRAVGWTSDQAEVGKEYAADAANTASKQVRLLYKLSSFVKFQAFCILLCNPVTVPASTRSRSPSDSATCADEQRQC